VVRKRLKIKRRYRDAFESARSNGFSRLTGVSGNGRSEASIVERRTSYRRSTRRELVGPSRIPGSETCKTVYDPLAFRPRASVLIAYVRTCMRTRTRAHEPKPKPTYCYYYCTRLLRCNTSVFRARSSFRKSCRRRLENRIRRQRRAGATVAVVVI